MAYEFVQAKGPAGDASTTTFDAPSEAGSLLICAYAYSGGIGRISTFTSGFSAVSTEYADSANYATGMYYYPNNPDGISEIGVTLWTGAPTVPGSRRMFIFEYRGIATTGALLTSTRNEQSSAGTATDAITSGSHSITLGAAPAALVFGIAGAPGIGTQMNAGTDYTGRLLNDGFRGEDKRITASASHAATWTANTTPTRTVAWLAAFAEPASSTPKGRMLLMGVG